VSSLAKETLIQFTRLLRSRINERLAKAAQFPLVLLVAPAGFGKTIALRDFLDTTRSGAVRYDVRREDRTFFGFLRGLSEALDTVAPGMGAAYPRLRDRIGQRDGEMREYIDWFLEHVKRSSFVLAIDDLHHASSDARTVAFVVECVERTIGRVQWILATRSAQGLPVASWIGYGHSDVPIGEDDLRFTRAEALAMASETQAEGDVQEAAALRDLTQGWPVALAIAVRTRMHASDLRAASAGTRDLIYQYLAEHVYTSLTERERATLLQMAIFPSFSQSMLEAGSGSGASLSTMRQSLAFVTEVEPGEFRFHDLFREFLETELRRNDAALVSRTHRAGAEIAERHDRPDIALALFARAGAIEGTLRILRGRGIEFFERGETDALKAALDALGDLGVRSEPIALALQAMFQSSAGLFEVAQKNFELAIAGSQDRDQRAKFVHRYAIELVRHHHQCIDLLEPYARDDTLPPTLRVALQGTLATAYARAGRIDDACATISAALRLLDGTMDDESLARFYQQAAFVHQGTADRGEAWAYARAALDLALRRNLFDVAARAYSVLYVIVYDDRDDPIESLRLLDRLIECARKSANYQTLAFGLAMSLDVAVDRGDEVTAAHLDRELEELPTAATAAQGLAEALLPARAMRLAWEGDTRSAFGLLHGTAPEQATADRRALRAAEIALYGFAAGEADAAEIAAAFAQECLAQSPARGRRVTRARLVLAAAFLVRGRTGPAHRLLNDVRRSLGADRRRLRTFADAVWTRYRAALGETDAGSIEALDERLRSEHLGGIARLFSALRFAGITDAVSLQSLTLAEREILRSLGRGLSSKEIAKQSGRSPLTVDTHVRSLCRKLGCRTRGEAVARALEGGWIDAFEKL